MDTAHDAFEAMVKALIDATPEATCEDVATYLEDQGATKEQVALIMTGKPITRKESAFNQEY